MTRARPEASARTGRAAGANGAAGGFALAPPLQRLAKLCLQEAERIARAPNPSVDALHRFHQRLRRLRSGLRAVRQLLPRSRRGAVSGTNQRLGRISRLVGEVRDLDVGLALLPAGDPRATEGPIGPLDLARRRMREEAHTGRALLGAFLRSEVERGLFQEPGRLIDAAGARLRDRGAERTFAEVVERAAATAERARRRASRRADPDRLHEFRIELRRAHYVIDLGGSAAGRSSSRFPGALSELQRSLGTLHDLDRLDELLRTLGTGASRREWLEATERDRRRLRRELVETMRRRSIRTALRALRA